MACGPRVDARDYPPFSESGQLTPQKGSRAYLSVSCIHSRENPLRRGQMKKEDELVAQFRGRMSITQAAKRWNLSKQDINNAIESGKLHYLVVSGTVQVMDCQMREWIAEHCIR